MSFAAKRSRKIAAQRQWLTVALALAFTACSAVEPMIGKRKGEEGE